VTQSYQPRLTIFPTKPSARRGGPFPPAPGLDTHNTLSSSYCIWLCWAVSLHRKQCIIVIANILHGVQIWPAARTCSPPFLTKCGIGRIKGCLLLSAVIPLFATMSGRGMYTYSRGRCLTSKPERCPHGCCLYIHAETAVLAIIRPQPARPLPEQPCSRQLPCVQAGSRPVHTHRDRCLVLSRAAARQAAACTEWLGPLSR
jgi:hypothetical protein